MKRRNAYEKPSSQQVNGFAKSSEAIKRLTFCERHRLFQQNRRAPPKALLWHPTLVYPVSWARGKLSGIVPTFGHCICFRGGSFSCRCNSNVSRHPMDFYSGVKSRAAISRVEKNRSIIQLVQLMVPIRHELLPILCVNEESKPRTET
jgi:hypothetical protein